MTLHFLGGPWDNRTVESEVSRAPKQLPPDPDEPGTYFRVEVNGDTGTVTYIWSAESDEVGSSRMARGRD